MLLEFYDWLIIVSFFLFSLGIGLYSAKTAGKNAKEFFLSGRNMPWWLLGVSMVATTFAADTPNLVTDIVRQNGVAGNWTWWAFLLTGMLTVFLYAKLWRRSGVMTDVEFYELRYSGKLAAFLRGFRALYLGVFFNILVMASVSLAIIKIGGIMMQWSPLQTIIISMSVTAVYSTFGGLKGILLTDFFQFIIAMVGSIAGAWILINLPEVGGLTNLLQHEEVQGKMNMLPDFSDWDSLLLVLILPLAVQWWSVWYPGSEPGGGGFIAQRMLSAKSERGAIGATLFFNVVHYAVRPWPWILIAFTSIIVYPDLASMQQAFPEINSQIIQHDFAYPAMLSLLPEGILGLVVASIIAAFMSTISTQVNWGASYVVNDFYLRFLNPQASNKQLVGAGRISTVILMVVASILALLLSNALQAFNILLQVGAGTGLIFILRWFWWRINAYSEIAAMVISFIVAFYLELLHPLTGFPAIGVSSKLLLGVGITTAGWLLVTFLTPPTDKEVLRNFYRLVHPGGPGWEKIIREAKQENDPVEKISHQGWDVPMGILGMVTGCFAVYTALFAIGNWLYGNYWLASGLSVACVLSSIALIKIFIKIKTE
jgi:SSS family solute:Na+ symporter